MEIKINWDMKDLYVLLFVLLFIGAVCFSIAYGKINQDKTQVIKYEKQIIEREIVSITNQTIYPESIGDCVNVIMENKTMVMRCILK